MKEEGVEKISNLMFRLYEKKLDDEMDKQKNWRKRIKRSTNWKNLNKEEKKEGEMEEENPQNK